MTKSLLLTSGLIFCGITSFAQPTRTTIANGNATNPFIWDCTCIPSTGDHIVINHNVTLDIDYAVTSGSVTIGASAQLIGNIPTRSLAVTGGSFNNYGVFTIGNLYHGGGTFNNNGGATITVTDDFASDLSAVTNNYSVFNVNDTAYINVNATVNNSGYVTMDYLANAGSFNNTGGYAGIDIYSSGSFSNASGTGLDVANIYTSGTFASGASATISNDFWNSETVTISGHMVIDGDLWTGDTIAGTATFTNHGTISVAGSLTNSEDINGTGKFCIGATSTNSGNVSGTLDVCDLTGTDFDFNFGTVAGTVTHCSVSCAIGMEENTYLRFEIYPNPADQEFIISLLNAENTALTIFNQMGEVVMNQNLNQLKNTIDVSGLSSGIYLVKITGTDHTSTLPLVKR